jgi:hypothetical protein
MDEGSRNDLLADYKALLLAHLKEIYDEEVRVGVLSSLKAASLLMHLEYESQHLTAEQVVSFEAWAFAKLLKERQGTVMPNFEAFHRKRTRLERKILRPGQKPPREWPPVPPD